MFKRGDFAQWKRFAGGQRQGEIGKNLVFWEIEAQDDRIAEGAIDDTSDLMSALHGGGKVEYILGA